MAQGQGVQQRIEDLVQNNRVMLFMKGNREQPQCGFSAQVVQILDELLPDYQTFDVFSDASVREGIKEFSNWPTLPQLYIQGEFVGGCDIVREMYESGELHTALGFSQEPLKTPTIHVTDTAAKAIRNAQRGQDGDAALHLAVDARFQYRLGFGPRDPGQIEVEANGLRILLTPASARRADGLTIDAAETPQGLRISIDNPNEPRIVQLTPQDLAQLRASGVPFELIDVRTIEERNRARIDGARLLDDETRRHLDRLPRETKLVFHCHHGGRSQAAAEEYALRGFRDVNNLAGGIDAWSQLVDPSVPRY
jgi:monothiol glutaredoxin